MCIRDRFLRVLFKDGHKVEGNECIVNGKKYELPPDILGNKDKYEFLQWGTIEAIEISVFFIVFGYIFYIVIWKINESFKNEIDIR